MRSLTAVVVAMLFAAAVSPSAHAGVYEVRSCGSAGDLTAFAPSGQAPPGLAINSQCPRVAEAVISGLSVASTSLNAARGAAAAWTITAPPSTALRRLDVQRSLGKRDKDWSVVVRTAEGALLDTCEIGPEQFSCSRGPSQETDTIAYTDLRTSGVSFRVECIGAFFCAGWTSPTQAWIAVYSAVALVDDPAPPVVEPLSGALLAPGWHRGVEPLELGAADASGIRSLSVTAGGTSLYHQDQSCDYSRMQPCPASRRETVAVDTSWLVDGTHELRAVATDAAAQPGTATATVRIDRTAPAKPNELAVERNPDGTLALLWTNPDQGTAAPIVGSRYEVCDAMAVRCVSGAMAAGRGISRVDSVAVPAGEHVVRVWLQDEAGNVDRANAAVLSIDPSTLTAPRVLDTNPPVLSDGHAPSPRLRITRARRSGSTLTLSGTIARGATARISAALARTKSGKPTATASAKPKRGKWSLNVRLTPALRNANTMYLSVRYAGQASYRKTTLQRRLAKKPPRRGDTAIEFSVEARSGRR
jgi:hypothetical protein